MNKNDKYYTILNKANDAIFLQKMIDDGLPGVRDVTEKTMANQKLQAAEQFNRAVLNSIPANIAVIDSEGDILAVNEAWCGFAKENGLLPSAVGVGANYLDVCREAKGDSANGAKDILVGIQSVINGTSDLFTYEYPCHSPTKEHWFLLYVTPLKGSNGAVIAHIDITDRKKLEQRVQEISWHDGLTDLYNRNYLNQEIYHLENDRCVPLGVIICDIDGLKLVNDSLGHGAGDSLLVTTANILQEVTANIKSNVTLARTGGDEFTVLLPHCEEKAVKGVVNRIRELIKRYNDESKVIHLSISVGYAVRKDSSYSIINLTKIADDNMYSEKLQHKQSAHSSIVQTLMKALEERDIVTEEHTVRVYKMMSLLARSFGIPEQSLSKLYLLAKFHDIGKVAIPETILNKPGPLTEDEYKEMKRHCEIGYRIAKESPMLAPIADLILKHHEWWDGNGYPLGAKGEEIPHSCRILSIVDAYDAMTSDRPYRKALTHQQAVAELKSGAGTQFDANLVAKFLQII